jgi:uncharacterized membrane protein YecN with MAPEG domain
MDVSIVSFYAGLLAVLFLILSVRVVRFRRFYRVAIGDGGYEPLQRAISVHNNFCQYVPFSLILFTFNEMQDVPLIWINFICTVFVAGRYLHAYGVSHLNENLKFRSMGMIATYIAIICSTVTIFLCMF